MYYDVRNEQMYTTIKMYTGNNTACYVVQFFINSLQSYRKQHNMFVVQFIIDSL